MKQLSKTQQAELQTALTACDAAAAQLNSAVEAFNTTIDEARGEVEAKNEAYNTAIADLKAVYEGFSGEAQGYFDERSEKWQESDAGSTYSEWIERLSDPDIEEIEIDFPDALEIETPDFTDTDWLPPVSPEE
jgi:hypothetical protein